MGFGLLQSNKGSKGKGAEVASVAARGKVVRPLTNELQCSRVGPGAEKGPEAGLECELHPGEGTMDCPRH